jgi:transcriptional regulator GlxA family with amidase domain
MRDPFTLPSCRDTRETGGEEVAMGSPSVDRIRVAIVAYQGVLADESAAFRDVLGRIPQTRVMTVGARRGVVAGPGGAQEVAATFGEVHGADVVVVPGGLGSHRHPEIARWLLGTDPRWVLTSSTGSALLAATGLLRGHTAATHWLAGPLLERYGVRVSSERLVVDDPFVTCSGLASAFEAAFFVVRHFGGPFLVKSIREEMRRDAAVPTSCHAPTRYRSRPARPPVASVEVELEDNSNSFRSARVSRTR